MAVASGTLLGAVDASAATISGLLPPNCAVGCTERGPVVRVTGDPSAPEALTVAATPDRVVLSSEETPVSPGENCEQGGTRRLARCLSDVGFERIEVRLGAARDVFTFSQRLWPQAVFAGGGDDELLMGGGSAHGEDGDDLIRGTGRGMVAEGGPGADRVEGSIGSDAVDGGPGPDVLDGAEGFDSVSWKGAPGPVTVDLALPDLPAGPAADPDLVRGFEQVIGTDGPDTIRGGPEAEELSGGAGDDVLEGRGGDDVLRGGGGADLLDGGDGDDALTAMDAGARLVGGPGADELGFVLPEPGAGGQTLDGGDGDDLLHVDGSPLPAPVCGPGVDTLEADDARGLQPPSDCERVSLIDRSGAVVAQPGVAGRRVVLRFLGAPCDSATPRLCRPAIAVRDARTRRLVGARRHPRGFRGGTVRLQVRCVPRQVEVTVDTEPAARGGDFTWSAALRPHPKRVCR